MIIANNKHSYIFREIDITKFVEAKDPTSILLIRCWILYQGNRSWWTWSNEILNSVHRPSCCTVLLVSGPASPATVGNIIGLVTFAFVTAICTAEIKHKSLQTERSKLHKRATGKSGRDWLGPADLLFPAGRKKKQNIMANVWALGFIAPMGDDERIVS